MKAASWMIPSTRQWRRKTMGWVLLELGALVCLTSGCFEDVPSGNTGTIVLRVTDSPYPFEMIASAEVTIDRVEARVIAKDSTKSGFYVLSETPRTMDLLDLRGGVTEVLVESEVPAGRLDEVRLHLASATVTLEDGRRLALDVPHGAQRAFRSSCSPAVEIPPDAKTQLLVDVDLSESLETVPSSVRRVGEIRDFKLHPCIRVANLQETGALFGHVRHDAGTMTNVADDAPLRDATIAVAGGGESWKTSTDASGAWCVMGLPPGAYVVTASAAAHSATQRPATVVVGDEAHGIDFALHRRGS